MNTVSKKSLIVFTILLTILISVSIILPISLKKKLDNVEIPEYSNESAYDIAVRHGYTGTKTEWLNSLKGKDKSGVDSIVYLSKENNTDTYAIIYKDGATYTFTVEKGLDATDGENGDKGPKGDKGADGHTPFVYITDDGYWAIDDEITTFPATVDAVDGKSAYDIWKEAGNEGTLKEFLDSLKGVDGLDGDDGLSAYELAKKNGFKGTEEAWLASLIGAKGEKGDAGSKGEAGDKGPTGDKGVTGNKGETGDKGEAGDKGEKGDKGDDATSIIDLKISNQYISKYDNYFTVYTYYLNNGKSFDKVVPIDYPVDYIEEKLYPSCFEIGISHQYAFIKGILTDGSALYFDVTDMVLSQIDLETEGIYDVSINFYNSDRAFSFDTKAYVAEEIYNEDIDVFEDVNYTPKDSAFANLDKFYLYAYSKGNKDRSESARLKFKYSETNPINTFHFVDDDAKNYLVPDGGVSGRFIKLIVDVELLYITITGPKTYIIEDCEFIRETRNACRREDATFMRYADFIYKYRYTPSVNSLANREYTNLGYFHQSDWQELDNYIYDYPIIYFEYQTGLYKMSKDHGFGISYDVEDIQNGTLPGISSHNKQMYTKYLGEFYYLNGEKVEIPDNEQVYNPFIISYNPFSNSTFKISE